MLKCAHSLQSNVCDNLVALSVCNPQKFVVSLKKYAKLERVLTDDMIDCD